jgi:hypothetical protein
MGAVWVVCGSGMGHTPFPQKQKRCNVATNQPNQHTTLMKFEPPTDEQKKQWAHKDTVMRAEFGGNVYEVAATGEVYALERTSPAPSPARKGKMGSTFGFLKLVGVIPTPTPVLLNNIKMANEWDGGIVPDIATLQQLTA